MTIPQDMQPELACYAITDDCRTAAMVLRYGRSELVLLSACSGSGK